MEWTKPEYRIVKDSAGNYVAQVRRWWWPFWCNVLLTLGMTEGQTEYRLRYRLRIERDPVVKYLGRITEDE
jgi:hypothetical protein